MSLGWVLALVSALECASAVRLMGDEAVRAPLVDALMARRVSVAAAGECAALVASVSARRGGVRLELLIGTRQVVREVTGTAMAAVVIESWLRPDLAQPLLTPREATRAAAPLVSSAPSVTAMPGEARREPVAGARAPRGVRAPAPVRAVASPTDEAPRVDTITAAASSSVRPARAEAGVGVSPSEPESGTVASPAEAAAAGAPAAPERGALGSPAASVDAQAAPLALVAAQEAAPGESPTPPIPRSPSAVVAPASDVEASAPATSGTIAPPSVEATPAAQAPSGQAAPVLASVTPPWARSGPSPAPVDAPRAPADTALTRGEPLLADWSFTVAPVLALDETSALWGGGQVRAAHALDDLVLEVRARVAYSEVQGSLQSSVSERWLVEALVGAAWPLELVDSLLALELAAGLGPRIVRVARGDSSSACLTRATCAVVVPDGFVVTGLTPAGQASVGLVWRASEHWAVELMASASWAPWASDVARVPAYAASLTGEEQARWALAGEPALVGVGALGVRWSGR